MVEHNTSAITDDLAAFPADSADLFMESANAFEALSDGDVGSLDQVLQRIKGFHESRAHTEIETFLRGGRSYLIGVNRLEIQHDPKQAMVDLSNAMTAYSQPYPTLDWLDDKAEELGGGEAPEMAWRDQRESMKFLASIMLGFADALVSLRVGNLSLGRQKLDELRSQVRSAGSDLARILTAFEPDLLFMAANATALLGELDLTRQLVTSADAAARYAAETYHRDNVSEYQKLLGMGVSYRSYLLLWETTAQVEAWAVYQIPDKDELIKLPSKAIEHLEHVEQSDVAKIELDNMRALLELLGAFAAFAAYFREVLSSNLNPKRQSDWDRIRRQVGTARSMVSEDGNGVLVARGCDFLDPKIQNARLLQRPKAKDAFSVAGVASCVAFAVLFFGVSVANWAFGLDLDGSTILRYTIPLGLIAGFGLSAPRLFELFSLGPSGDSGGTDRT